LEFYSWEDLPLVLYQVAVVVEVVAMMAAVVAPMLSSSKMLVSHLLAIQLVCSDPAHDQKTYCQEQVDN
jgi:hypothetical protein